jgi:hypothetical protein
MKGGCYRIRSSLGRKPYNRRTKAKWYHYITNRYVVTTKSEESNNSLKTLEKETKKPPGRAPYFKHFRAERRALSIIENIQLEKVNRKNYRNCRYLYYTIIPYLGRYLSCEDLPRVQEMEHTLYNWMLSYLVKSGRQGPQPNRVEVWRFRSNICQ